MSHFRNNQVEVHEAASVYVQRNKSSVYSFSHLCMLQFYNELDEANTQTPRVQTHNYHPCYNFLFEIQNRPYRNNETSSDPSVSPSLPDEQKDNPSNRGSGYEYTALL